MRKSLIIAGLFLVLAVGGYGAYWMIAAERARAAVDGWIADWRAAGYRVETGAIATGGFPGTVTVDLTAPAIHEPEGVWSWQGDAMIFEVRPWAPTDYRLELFGESRVTAPIAGRTVDMRLDAARAVGGAEVGLDGTLRRATLTLERLEIDAPALDLKAGAARLAASLDLPAEPPRSADEPTAELTLAGDGLALPPAYAGPLGSEVERLSTRLRLLGPLPRTNLRQALEGWRDAGGRLHVAWLQTSWGPLGLEADGKIRLDGLLRPAGRLDTEISGLGPAIDRFAEAGHIDRTLARLLSGAAELFAQSDGAGRRYIDAPLKAEDGGLFLGPIRLAALPPVIPPPAGAPEADLPSVQIAPDTGTVVEEDLPALEEPPTVGPEMEAVGE